MRVSHFTDATAYQCGTISRNGRSVVGRQRLAVHLVGDQDLGRRVGRVRRGRASGRSRGRPARSPAAPAAGGTAPWSAPSKRTSTPSACGPRLARGRRCSRAPRPARGGDGVVAPRLAGRQRPRRRGARCRRTRGSRRARPRAARAGRRASASVGSRPLRRSPACRRAPAARSCCARSAARSGVISACSAAGGASALYGCRVDHRQRCARLLEVVSMATSASSVGAATCACGQ